MKKVIKGRRKQQLPLAIAIILGLNFFLHPVVYAATKMPLDTQSTWAMSILGIIIIFLVFYLFIVIFQPERF